MTRALIIVAHPDDDAIFAGPLQLAQPWIEWQAVCITWSQGDARATEMIAWQKRAGGKPPLFLGFPDDPSDLKRKESSFTAAAVAETLQGLNLGADLVVTHDVMGEYGHPHHLTVAAGVRLAFAGHPVISFAHYRRDEDFKIEVPDFCKQAMEDYASQRKVVRHLHRKLKCCRIGQYRNEFS